MTNAVAPENTAPAVMAAAPMEMLARAVESGMAPDVIERLIGFAERIQNTNARMAFDKAMAAAMAKIPVVKKNRDGHGGRRYADIAAIASVVNPILAEYGLSYRYRSKREDNYLLVTCILAHEAGHYEENTLFAPIDNTGSKNPVQAIGSTDTYLRRYTLVQALGIAVGEDDDDGEAAERTPKTFKPTPQQYDEMVKRESEEFRKPRPENEDAYAARWKRIVETATDDAWLGAQWEEEAELRSTITWRRRDPNVMEEAVRRRQAELIAAQEKREADLQTKRLEAGDQ